MFESLDEMKKEKDKQNDQPDLAPSKKKPKNLFWIWIVLTAVVAGGGVGVFAYRGAIHEKLFGQKVDVVANDNTVIENATEPTASTSVKSTSTSGQSSLLVADPNINWLASRVKLSDLGLFAGVKSADFPDGGYLGTDYYKVASTTSGDDIILAIVKDETLSTWDNFYHFIKSGNVYYLITENSDAIQAEFKRTNSEVNSTLVINSLLSDKVIVNGSLVLTQNANASRNDFFIQSNVTGSKVMETKWGNLYLYKGDDIAQSQGTAKVAQYYLLRNDGVKMIYWPNPDFRRDDGTLSVTWSNKAGEDKKFSQIKTSGCGGGGGSFPLAVEPSLAANASQVAVSSNGSKVYVPGADSMINEFAYQVYLMDNMGGKDSKADFISNLGVLVWKDNLDNWQIYMNDQYAPAVECGKPVIYLYPTKDQDVSVKVGADIRISDPQYGQGWKVFAHTDGKLTLNNKSYPYLFWEGQGLGSYPSIKSGTVVKRGDVEAKIDEQLASIGLNSKEIKDFKEFWMPKMPNTPFVRLTWLTNKEMDNLAPLAVSPKPDSKIRVFLDFEGLNQKINLTAQSLPKYDRKGFTLVEWGGLLVGKK